MTHRTSVVRIGCAGALALSLTGAAAQQAPRKGTPPPPIVWAAPPLPDGPIALESAEHRAIRVVVLTNELSHPWSLAFLPDGTMLVTERAGRLRVIRNGTLDPKPVAGVPQVSAVDTAGLLDIALHPRFSETRLVYLTYHKPFGKQRTLALARAQWDGESLTNVRELLSGVTSTNAGSRIAFGRDGLLYMTYGNVSPESSQDLGDLSGKILRLRDDGRIPPDNPFVNTPGARPEIYSLGHRNMLGLAVNPQTQEIWAAELGPNGGDELNVIRSGRNYGWPIVSYGRDYRGPRMSDTPWREGLEPPLVFWVPSVSVSGMAFYTGNRFPAWKGNVLVGALQEGEVPRTGHLERILFNDQWEELRRESLLGELKQRIRDVREGPDGLVYLLTDEDPGALLRIEPR